MVAVELSPTQTRAQDKAFVQQCSFVGLRPQLPLRWPVPPGLPASPKKRYRSHYVYLGYDDLDDSAHWEHLSTFDLVLRLVDFSPLRPLLAWLLGWTSARGKVPFDPLSFFLLISWQITHGWSRAEALRNIQDPRYTDYKVWFGFLTNDYPTEGGVRYFLTTIGHHSAAHDDTISVPVDDEHAAEIAIQYLNHVVAGAAHLLHQAHLLSPQAWQQAQVCPDGMIHDAASAMRCTSVQDSCYQPLSTQAPRPCPAQDKGKRGCDCDTLRCVQACRYAPTRDPQARCVYYARSNQPIHSGPNASAETSAAQQAKGELRYGYKSLVLQLADPVRRFSMVLADDFLSANEREENPAAALLLQLPLFYADLVVETVAGDAGLGYYAFLHACYLRGAKRVVDLRADPSDRDKALWTVRGYNDKGRPICPFGYAFTANGFDAQRKRHKWFCRQACLKGTQPAVQIDALSYPPDECPYQNQQHPYGKVLNVAETFQDGSIRLVRDVPVSTPTWKRLYHRARNASEDRNSDLESWGLKRLPLYGSPRGRALVALADAWLNLTTLARLVREATIAARISSG
ncbi:MAG: hypothetical protein GWN58_04785 [Anaerolineae bacterium]|nr:hypothetical protein [Anaerolineae bacterium]